jgi:hypothetical protein
MVQSIDEIIKALDEAIEESNEEFITPIKGEKILTEKGLLESNSAKSGEQLRLLIKLGYLPHAYKDKNYWRIPKSKKLKNDSPETKNSFKKFRLQIIVWSFIVLILSILLWINYRSQENLKEAQILEKRISELKKIAKADLIEIDMVSIYSLVAYYNLYALDKKAQVTDIYIETTSNLLENGEVRIVSTETAIQTRNEYIKSDSIMGIPISFYYFWRFNKNDFLLEKKLAVRYTNDSIKYYRFNENIVKLLFIEKLSSELWEIITTSKVEKESARLKHKKQKQERKARRDSIEKAKQEIKAKNKQNNKYEGYYKLSSSYCDIESSYDFVTAYEMTYLTVDLPNDKITLKTKFNGSWQNFTYPISNIDYQRGIILTVVYEINSLGVDEFWIQPEVPSFGIDYLDGTRIACYGVSVLEWR